MLKITCYIAIVLSVNLVSLHPFAQQKPKDTTITKEYFKDNDVLTLLDQKPPHFEGGKNAWKKYLKTNINIAIPFTNKAPAKRYKVIVRFLIDHHGAIGDISALSNCGYGMEDEFIRCIKKSPNWIPAEMKDGRKVSYVVREQITFNVSKADCTIEIP